MFLVIIINQFNFLIKMIKSVILDFDGVIHDTLKIAYSVAKIFYPDLTLKQYKNMFNGNIYSHKKVIKKFRAEFLTLQHEKYLLLKIEREIKKELLKLKKKYNLYIISSNSESTLNLYFENNNIIHLFDEVLGYETHTSKEHKFNMILKKHKLKKNECIFVTDTLGDILEANKIGIKTIAVDYGFHDRKRLEKGKPLKIISDFKGIEKVINSMTF